MTGHQGVFRNHIKQEIENMTHRGIAHHPNCPLYQNRLVMFVLLQTTGCAITWLPVATPTAYVVIPTACNTRTGELRLFKICVLYKNRCALHASCQSNLHQRRCLFSIRQETVIIGNREKHPLRELCACQHVCVLS